MCPLPQGNALITYKNLKQEMNCERIEIECESMSEINVG